MQNCNPWQNTIHNLSFQPFVLHYWTPDQLRVYNSFVKKEPAAKICIDATGDVVKKINRPSTLSKYIFIYLIVIKLTNENEGQISVCQMLSESHNTNTIMFLVIRVAAKWCFVAKRSSHRFFNGFQFFNLPNIFKGAWTY